MAKVAVTLVAFAVIFATKVDANISYKWKYVRKMQAHYVEPSQCDDIIAYYKFDRSLRDVCFGNNAVSDERSNDYPLRESSGISNGAVVFSGSSNKLRISDLNGYKWGSQFSVSLWFKSSHCHTQHGGLISNGYINTDQLSNRSKSIGSWELKLTKCEKSYGENTQDCIGASIVTTQSVKAWENVTIAISKHWHHLVMTYDGNTINFYLDNHLKLSDSECCHGDIVTKNTDVVIGYTRESTYNHEYDRYFCGTIDEVMLLKRALSAQEVTKLYRLETVETDIFEINKRLRDDI